MMPRQSMRVGMLMVAWVLLGSQVAWATSMARVVVFGLDETGSYSFREKAINMAKSIIAELEPGDVFYLRRITDKSYHDDCAVFRLQVPEVGLEPSNRFDPRARTAWLKSKRRAEQAKAQAQDVVSALPVVKAPRTDIWGFFAAAADRLQVEANRPLKLVILASDLKHNTGVTPQIDLRGCEVHVVGFETGRNPVQAQQQRDTWLKGLQACNVKGVSFHPIDCRFNIKSR